MNTFNLLTERWIPALYEDGTFERVGIRQVLDDANRIRQIAASNPMDRVAIFRFLLALLYWCKGNPPDKGHSGEEDFLPRAFFEKIEQHEECFDLLGDGKRFYQNCNYRDNTPEHTTNYLIHEVPSGTNKRHFRHSTDKVDGLCPACCAMGLLRLPVFATSGGRGMKPTTGKSPGINAKPPLYVIPFSSSLASTLRMSWIERDGPHGTPAWEDPNVQLPEQGKVPLLTGMTWLPRSVWLGDVEEPASRCISCGSERPLIRLCVFDGKGSQKAEGRDWCDPHVVYLKPTKGEVNALRPDDALGRSDAASGAWARILSQIPGSYDLRGMKSLWVVGFSTVQNDKYLEATEWEIPFSCLPEIHHDVCGTMERWLKESSSLAKKVLPSGGKRSSRNHKVIPPMLAAVRPDIEHRVCAEAAELLAGGDETWEQAAQEYRPMMSAIARSLSPGFTTDALQQRRQIARAAPNLRTKSIEKSDRKKGGDK